MPPKLLDFSTWDTDRASSRVMYPITYIKVNGPALLIAFMTYTFWTTFSNSEELICWRNAFLLYIIGTVKGYVYIIYLYFVFRDRQKYFHEVHTEMENNRNFWGHIFWCSVRTSFSAIFLEVVNTFGVFYFYGINMDPVQFGTKYGILSFIIFILKFFCWEIWFDFGHYWGHRTCHILKRLYEFGHVVHHESESPDAWDGLNITFDDALITNFVPHMFSMFITTAVFGSSFYSFEYHILGSYKTFVEVTGHVGVDFRGRSFPIFPPLPYYLGIDIGTAAYHSLHHLYYNFNFSKRFSLWDRVFGTMLIPPILKTGSKQEILKKYKGLLKR